EPSAKKRGEFMPKTIQQNITLKASPEMLFDMYLNSRTHEAITGAPVVVDSRAGSVFKAFDHRIYGKMLYVVPKRLIVQSWRAAHWMPEELDSILILTFWPAEEGGRIELVQVNVADHDAAAVNE